MRAAIFPKDHEKIMALQGEFGKLKSDFDRAVDVTVLTLARRSGKYWPSFGLIYISDIFT
jgi:hypothetical protein